MAMPDWVLTTTCDIYRPFGAAAPLTVGIPCRETGDWPRGQSSVGIRWTHRMDIDPSVDIRDGATRSANALVWADGDEVRIPSGGRRGLSFPGEEKMAMARPKHTWRGNPLHISG